LTAWGRSTGKRASRLCAKTPMASSLPAPQGCEVRTIPNKGAGLFTTAPRIFGEQVFTDEPMFVVQHSGNRRVATVCANCCAFVGPLHLQLEALFSEPRFAQFLASLKDAVPHWQAEIEAAGLGAPCNAVRCSQGCGEVYCSEACRAAHFNKCHNLLCVGLVNSEDHPLLRFKYHAIEHSDSLLLTAQVMACLVNRARACGGGAAATQALMSELLGFCHAPFREACRPPPGRGKDMEFLAHTDALINEAASLLKAAFDVHAPAEAAALFAAGPAFFSEVMGLFEYNNIDVEVASPFRLFFAAKGRSLLARAGDPSALAELALIERLLREKEWLMRCIWGEETTGNYSADGDDGITESTENEAMEEELGTELGDSKVVEKTMAKVRDEVERLPLEQLLEAPWPAFHGSALFVFVARLNHSCSPNVKLSFPGNSARICATATAPMAIGEELCICYINQEDNVQTRRKQLLEWYGFVCSCERCAREDSGAVRKTQKRLK